MSGLRDSGACLWEGVRVSVQRLPVCEGQDEGIGLMVDKVVERSTEERLTFNVVMCEPTISEFS